MVRIGKRGVTLIEAVLYAAIALVLIIGGLIFFKQADEDQKTSQMIRLASAVVAETRTLHSLAYSSAGKLEYDIGYGTLLAANGSLPSQYLKIKTVTLDDIGPFQTSIETPWGGGMELWVLEFEVAYSMIWVFIEDVPVSACTRLIRSNVPSDSVNETSLNVASFGFPAANAIGDKMMGGFVTDSHHFPYENKSVLRNYSTSQAAEVCRYGSTAYGATIGPYTGTAPRLDRVNMFLLYMY